MLPGFILDRMPWVIIWVDDAIMFYWESLIVFVCIFIAHHYVVTSNYAHSGNLSLSGLTLVVFTGVNAWLTYCGLRYGYAVG